MMSLNRFAIILVPLMGFVTTSSLSQNGSTFSPKADTYLWPTNASNYLSSTFAETRSAHFHSALDIKTWGQKGYNVYATRDGILYRIAIGPTGYGKVVYLKHHDGSYSVYAHLLRFEERIQQMADSLRLLDYRFEIDRTLDSLNIAVKQGDLIGLSGASGIGPPHLHFELRTPEEKPFNPLLTNLTVQDNIAPQFSNLSIEPFSIEAKIEGRNRIFTKRAWRRNGKYTFGTIDVSGPVGLGVDVFDQADKVHNAYAVYELKMFVDGELRFHSKVDHFSYEETSQMFVDRVYPILQSTRAGYQRLYIADGNTLPFYKEQKKSAKLDLNPGLHEVQLIATDYFGNSSEANITLRVKETAPIPVSHQSSTQRLSSNIDPSNWSWFESWVNIPQNDLSQVTVAYLGHEIGNKENSFIENRNEASVDLSRTRDVFFRFADNRHFITRKVFPNSFSIVPSTTDESYAAFPAQAFYDTTSVGLQITRLKADSVRIDVYPSSQPLKQPYKLRIAMDSTQMAIPGLGLYSYSRRKNSYSYLSSYRIDNFLKANPEDLGTFYILQDTTAPQLYNPRLVKRTDGQWLVYITSTDSLSGIDHNRTQFYMNGVRGIAEYEPEDKRIVYYHPDFQPSEDNELKVIAYDMEGNKAEETFELSHESK